MPKKYMISFTYMENTWSRWDETDEIGYVLLHLYHMKSEIGQAQEIDLRKVNELKQRFADESYLMESQTFRKILEEQILRGCKEG